MADSIIGKWNYKLDLRRVAGIDITYEFFDNGTYTYRDDISGNTVKGEYEVSGNKINYITTGTSDEFSLEDDRLTLTTKGHSGTYNRVY